MLVDPTVGVTDDVADDVAGAATEPAVVDEDDTTTGDADVDAGAAPIACTSFTI